MAGLQKKLVAAKENHAKLLNSLTKIREQQIKDLQDIELQLVLQRGIVEVHMSGSIKDFEDAIMVSRADVDKINKIITVGHK